MTKTNYFRTGDSIRVRFHNRKTGAAHRTGGAIGRITRVHRQKGADGLPLLSVRLEEQSITRTYNATSLISRMEPRP